MNKNVINLLEKKQTLCTERLVLRTFLEGDAKDVYAYASDPQTVRYLFWEGTATLEEARQATLKFCITPGFYAITRRVDNLCIGSVAINLEQEHEKASCGYALNRAYWNQGYMTEALNAIFSYCFEVLELNRVEAIHYVGNEASGAVMQKCGMQYEGLGRQEDKVKGRFCDAKHYAILKKDWNGLQGRV